MNRNELNLATPLDAARFYLALKFPIVPVPREGSRKGPTAKGWQTKRFELKDFVGPLNIGVRLGEEIAKDAYLADVDIDMKLADKRRIFPGAADIVRVLLPEPWAVFGRDSAPRAHLLFLTSQPVTSAKYKGLDGAVLVELRGLAAKAKSPNQTVIPPSIHESEEVIQFDDFSDLGMARTISADGLAEAVKHAAIALAILQIWPARGSRHDARLAFAKILLAAAIPPMRCGEILKAVMRLTGSDVEDVDRAISDTQAKGAKDTIGAKWVIDNIERGKETLAVIDAILGRKPPLPEGSFNVTNVDLKTLTPHIWARVKETNEPAVRLLHGGLPIRVVRLPEPERTGRRPTWVFQSLHVDRLRNEVAQIANFFRTGEFGLRQIAPPNELVRDMLATRPERIPLPVVTRIVYAPTMAPGGTIQLTPGFQPATSTFYVDSGLDIPPVTDTPGDEDVKRAVTIILTPLSDFPFVHEADRTAAVAFLLLPFVRDLIIGPTPMHLFKKPIAGAGATLLTDTLLYPSVGTDIAKMSTVKDDDEWRKQITSTLLDGPTVVLIDNARELVSPQLAKAITDDIWQARILGVSRNATLRVDCVWGATGINPDLHQELARRVVPCCLDPRDPRPWLRTEFLIPDLRAWSREHRASMIWAALTVARAWYVAGRPKGDRSLGMFEHWAHVVGGILKHAGFKEFLGNLEEVYEDADVEGDAVHWLFSEWHRRYQHKPTKISDVAAWALDDASPILAVLTSRDGIRVQFSKWFRSLKGRVVDVGGQRLWIAPVKLSGDARTHTWHLASERNPQRDSESTRKDGTVVTSLPF